MAIAKVYVLNSINMLLISIFCFLKIDKVVKSTLHYMTYYKIILKFQTVSHNEKLNSFTLVKLFLIVNI